MRDSLLILICISTVTAAFVCAEEKLSADEQAIVDLTNKEREKKGMKPLTLAKKLQDAARNHSENMARQSKMEHELDGKLVGDRVKDQGYFYLQVGENIGLGHATPDEMMKAWMGSEGHRRNILTANFTEIGVSIVKDSEGQPYYTQVFGRSRDDGPTETARFTVRNNTESTIRLTLPGKYEAKVEPDHVSTFTVAGVGELPPFQITVANETRDIPSKNGAKYIIEPTRKGFDVLNENEPRKRNGQSFGGDEQK